MTALFTATTAVCLALLAALALQIDSASRAEQLTSSVNERAGGLARAIYFDAGSLYLQPLTEDELARGAEFVAVALTGSDAAGDGLVYRSGGVGIDADAAVLDGLVADVVEDQGAVQETVPSSLGGRTVWAGAPVWDDDTIGAVVLVGQDTTVQDEAHGRLAIGLAIGCMSLLLGAAATGFLLSGRAMRPATEALSGQEQFLAEASHELRTPLASLRLQAESGDGDATRLVATVDRLDHLVTALLARARVQSGSFAPERIPLRLDQLVEQVVDEYGDSATIGVNTVPVVVTGDPVLIAQAVRNIVDNALRYAPEGGLHVTVVDDGVIVDDHGPGIPAADRAHVVRAGAGTGRGLGAGLAIVGWIMELHEGSLELTDAPGRGLRVHLRFPIAQQSI